MSAKSMDTWFFMRRGFTTFRLEPDKHCHLLFGDRDRNQRDLLLRELEGASYSNDGHKAVIFGDSGRGKTHMCHNLAFLIARSELGVLPIYIKCSSYSAREPFQSLFRQMVTKLATEEVNRVATEYARMVLAGKAVPIETIVQSEEIALVMKRGLTAPDVDAVRTCLRWLGGEPKVAAMQLISQSLRPQLTDSRDFGAVLRGLAHMFVTVDQKVLLYLIDEAERFENVTNADTFASWLGSLRELTEIVDVGLMFFILARTRDRLPVLLLQDEITRRIGVVNYVEFRNPSRDQLREFLIELFATMLRKGEVPDMHKGVVDPLALDPTVPDELLHITGGDPDRLRTFPFDPDAFEEFVEQVAGGEMTNKPSEVLVRLQKAAQRAMLKNARSIDIQIVDALAAEGI